MCPVHLYHRVYLVDRIGISECWSLACSDTIYGHYKCALKDPEFAKNTKPSKRHLSPAVCEMGKNKLPNQGGKEGAKDTFSQLSSLFYAGDVPLLDHEGMRSKCHLIHLTQGPNVCL